MAQISDFSGGVDSTLAGIPAGRAALNQNALGQTNDFLNRYRGAINGQETMSAMANRIGSELNLPTLRSNANTINSAVNNLPYTYSAATRGYDVNSNQLDRIVGQKTYEMTPAMNTANTALNSAESNLSTRLGYGVAEQQKQLMPYQSEQGLLSDRLAREATGFGQDQEAELNGYISKMQGGITLSEGEATRANQLAVAKMGYDAQLKAAEIGATSSQNVAKINNQYQTLNPAQKLVNMQTGASMRY